MHPFGWLSEKGGVNFFNLLQKDGGTQKGGGGFPQKRGGSNPGGNYDRKFKNKNNLCYKFL